jgi:hypothetical protein
MQHVLPRGFVRIRSFGLLSHRDRDERLAHCRQLLGDTEQELGPAPGDPPACRTEAEKITRCPYCGQRALQSVARTPRARLSELVASTYQRQIFDSS